MEHDEVTRLGWPGDQLKHPSGGVGADDEHSVVGIDQADGIGDGVPDGFVADAMSPSRPGNPSCCVPHYQDGRGQQGWRLKTSGSTSRRRPERRSPQASEDVVGTTRWV